MPAPEDPIPVYVNAPTVFPDLEYTPQVYEENPRKEPVVPNAKNIAIACFNYSFLAYLLIYPTTTWDDLREMVLEKLSLNTTGKVTEPMGILEVALAGIPFTVRGTIGCQDPQSGFPYETVPENGVIYVQQVRRAHGWVPLMNGMSLPKKR